MGNNNSHRLTKTEDIPAEFQSDQYIQSLKKKFKTIAVNDRIPLSVFHSQILSYVPKTHRDLVRRVHNIYAKGHKSEEWNFDDFFEFNYLLETRNPILGLIVFESFGSSRVNEVAVVEQY